MLKRMYAIFAHLPDTSGCSVAIGRIQNLQDGFLSNKPKVLQVLHVSLYMPLFSCSLLFRSEVYCVSCCMVFVVLNAI